MSIRECVERITDENWRTSACRRWHAGIGLMARIEEAPDGTFVGVHGYPEKGFGYTTRFETLNEALAWVNREPQPFAVVDVVVPRTDGRRNGPVR